jgi:hypothetical protein
MLKVYLVVSLVISYVKMITSVKTLEIFCNMVAMERKTIIVIMATEQSHFASSKKKT